MSSTLNVSVALINDHYLVSASLADGGTLPREIFVYENTGDGTLGSFFGTCDLQELGRLSILTLGIPQPTFGNLYVRHWEAKIVVPLSIDPTIVVNALVANVKTLSLAYASQSGFVNSYNIP